MWWRVEAKVNHLNKSVAQSFVNVRKDTDAIFQWISYLSEQHKVTQQQLSAWEKHARDWQKYGEALHERIQAAHSKVLDACSRVREIHSSQGSFATQMAVLDQEIKKTNSRVAQMPVVTSTDIKRVVDSHYSFGSIAARLRAVEERISSVETAKPAIKAIVQEQQQRPSTRLQEKVMRRISRNSKDYIKNTMLSLIAKYEKISGLQLREMLVEEQGLCSKSSFYRILSEIESNANVAVSPDGKEKIYASRSGKTNSEK